MIVLMSLGGEKVDYFIVQEEAECKRMTSVSRSGRQRDLDVECALCAEATQTQSILAVANAANHQLGVVVVVVYCLAAWSSCDTVASS